MLEEVARLIEAARLRAAAVRLRLAAVGGRPVPKAASRVVRPVLVIAGAVLFAGLALAVYGAGASPAPPPSSGAVAGRPPSKPARRVSWTRKIGDWVQSSPAVAGGVVYVGSDDGRLYALDAVSGAKRWSYRTGGEVGSGPAVAGGAVYVGSHDGNVYALNVATG